MPLVREAFDWEHGVFLGSTMSSEMTAAAFGTVGKLRFDPFAMLPFCGYDMGAYFEHWLEIGRKGDADKLPRIFYVNWFRKDADGKFIWPGFGENSRVLEWVFRRCNGESAVVETPIGNVPAPGELNVEGLDISDDELAELLASTVSSSPPSSRRSRSTWPGSTNLPSELQAHLDKLKADLR